MPNWVGNRELDVVVAIIILRTMRIYCTIFAYTESCLAANFIYRSITDDDDANEEENCQKENWKAANRQLATVQVSMQLLYSTHIPYYIVVYYMFICSLFSVFLFFTIFPKTAAAKNYFVFVQLLQMLSKYLQTFSILSAMPETRIAIKATTATTMAEATRQGE